MSRTYVINDLVDEVVDFIKSCPFFEDYGVSLASMQNLQFEKVNLKDAGSSSIEYNGSKLLKIEEDVNGTLYRTRASSFSLYFIRSIEMNCDRYDMTNFLYNFEQWVDYKTFTRDVPKLSRYINDKEVIKYKEGTKFNASNASLLSVVEDEDISIYTINLDVTYEEELDSSLIGEI